MFSQCQWFGPWGVASCLPVLPVQYYISCDFPNIHPPNYPLHHGHQIQWCPALRTISVYWWHPISSTSSANDFLLHLGICLAAGKYNPRQSSNKSKGKKSMQCVSGSLSLVVEWMILKCFHLVLQRQNNPPPPANVHILTRRICEYVTLYGKMDLANLTEDLEIGRLS